MSHSGNYYLVATNSANAVTSSIVNVSISNYVVRPINPKGNLYTDISDSGHFNSSFVGANMFEHDMTDISVGTFLSFDATEFARAGGGPSYVAFQLDQVYTNILSIFYANRNAGGDWVTSISIWASDTTPFTAADPLTDPTSTTAVTNAPMGVYWNEYFLTNTFGGRYFLLKLDQTTPSGNPGGREFRLGGLISPDNLIFTATPDGLVLNWSNGILEQADNITGPWTTATGVTSGVAIPTTAASKFYRIRY